LVEKIIPNLLVYLVKKNEALEIQNPDAINNEAFINNLNSIKEKISSSEKLRVSLKDIHSNTNFDPCYPPLQEDFMEYKIYAAEYKWALIEEYQSRNVSIRAYCKEKELSLSTFESWLAKLRKSGQLGYKKDKAIIKSNSLPIDVTDEAKAIIKEGIAHLTKTFSLETKGMRLTFSLSDLKTVLEVINNG